MTIKYWFEGRVLLEDSVFGSGTQFKIGQDVVINKVRYFIERTDENNVWMIIHEDAANLIDQQAARIRDLECLAKAAREDFPKQAARIIDLRKQIGTLQDTRDGWIKIFNEKDAQIAALKEIAIEERAIWIYETSPDGGALVHMFRPKEIGECWKWEASRLLEAEHPEAMR